MKLHERVSVPRKAWFIATAVVLAVAAALVVVVLRNNRPMSIGAGVKVEGGNLPDNLNAAVAEDGGVLPLSDIMQAVSSFFEIGPSGPLPGPMTVYLPLAEQVSGTAEDYVVVVFTADSLEGPWEALPTTVSEDGKTAIATTTHLSFLTTAIVWIGKKVGQLVDKAKSVLGVMKAVFDGLTDYLFSDAEPPTCTNEDAARQDTYNVTAEPKDTILWCFGMEGGQRVLKVTANRRYPLSVEHPGLSVVDDGRSFRLRLAQLSRVISGGNVIVFPGETVVFGVDLPESGGSGGIQTRMDGPGQSLYALEVGIRTALQLLTQFGAGSGVAVNGRIVGEMPIIDVLDSMLQGADCLAAVTDGSHDIGKLISACFNADQLLTVWGKWAVFLAPLMVAAPVINFFRSEFDALGDQFNRRDQQRLTISRANLAALCPTAEAGCLDVRQADVDGDSQLDTVALVYDTTYSDCRLFRARVVFSTGEVSQGDLCFPTTSFVDGVPHTVTPEEVQFSIQGFADVNGYPGMEIAARVFYEDVWRVKVLELAGEKGGPLELLSFDHPHNINNLGATHGSPSFADVAYSGFRCERGDNGQPLLIVWTVRGFDWDYDDLDEYTVSQTTFEHIRPGMLSWVSVDALDVYERHPMTSLDQPLQRAEAERAKGSCDGLGEVPFL